MTLRHKIHQDGVLTVRERQDIVYKEISNPGSGPQPASAREDEIVSDKAQFEATTLFRYSALTFNGHRIHYDLDYCQNVEGYSGLVVHGPLLAQLLIGLADKQLNGVRTFEFRAMSPLMHFEPAQICMGADNALWVRGPDGRLCMRASAT